MTIGDWHLLNPLGLGQSGEVYEVRETCWPFRHGALKIFSGRKLKVSEEDFENESKIVEAQPIPGRMPKFYGRGRHNGILYYVMEFAEKLPDDPTPQQIAILIDSLAESIGLLYAAQYLHNDIKPKNLGIIRGKLVILDFGSACLLKEAAAERARTGTPFYMAREVREGGILSLVANIHSIGATLDEVAGDEAQHVFGPLIRRACADDPGDRPQSIPEFRAELNAAIPAFARLAAKATRLERFVTVARRVGRIIIAYLAIMGLVFVYRQAILRIDHRSEAENEKNFQTALEDINRHDYSNAVILLERVSRHENNRCKQAAVLRENLRTLGF